jgi:hypothetical protein
MSSLEPLGPKSILQQAESTVLAHLARCIRLPAIIVRACCTPTILTSGMSLCDAYVRACTSLKATDSEAVLAVVAGMGYCSPRTQARSAGPA